MADFPTCYSFMLPNEDFTPPQYAQVADPPPGSWAISGINSHAWSAQFAVIAAIPQAQRAPAVEAFYQQNIWNVWLSSLSANAIAMRVFDSAVNQGFETATRILQTAINALGGGAVGVDGEFGPLTLTAANSANVARLVPVFQAARIAVYQADAEAAEARGEPWPPNLLSEYIARASK